MTDLGSALSCKSSLVGSEKCGGEGNIDGDGVFCMVGYMLY
jgi:hypothetical protein